MDVPVNEGGLRSLDLAPAQLAPSVNPSRASWPLHRVDTMMATILPDHPAGAYANPPCTGLIR